jgi:hypothetical protein
MKSNLTDFTDFLSMLVGVVGALLKGLKQRLSATTIILSCLVAGILSYASMGLIEVFYSDLSPRLVIFISFCVGWIANEITAKLDLLVNDFYDIFIGWVRSFFKFKSRNNENENNKP